MQIRARSLLAVGIGLLFPTLAAAQGVWVPHQEPCKLSTGHYLVKGSMLHLKIAIESQFEDSRANRLEEAHKVLLEAILEKDQAENAAAWYYLGRTYAESHDFAGADSAFTRAVALAPDCAEDVAAHRSHLATFALNEALRTWGSGVNDSARRFFALARSLDTTDAEIPLYTSIMFASAQEPDSAAAYLELGIRAAATDTAHGQRLRQASIEVARGYESRAFQDVPASLTVGQTRLSRDTTAQRIVNDSTLLDRIVTEVSGIRAAGQHLNPQALASFQRDSTLLETRLATARHAHDSLVGRAATDSAAVVAALAPAQRAYGRHAELYPDDAEVLLQRVRLAAAMGDRATLDDLVTQVTKSAHVTTTSLVPTAMALFGDGLNQPAARLAEAALSRNPNDHAALALATHVYHGLGDAERLHAIAARRLELAPLDDAAARAMALAWDVAGTPDSVARWLAVADTGLAWKVHVSQFQATEHSTSVNGYVANAVPRALGPLTLTFEFLDDGGAVVFSTAVDVPALEPRGRAPLSVRVDQGGAASWRYRRE
jgi:tetratricopeptide (TPR) repeat protein